MYLTTPQRYPLFKGVPNSPVMPRPFYQTSSPTMSFVNPFVQQNTYRPQPSLPISQRAPIPTQNPNQRAQTPQARITGKAVPSNPPPQRVQGSLSNNAPPKGQNPQTVIPNKPYTRTMPQPNIKPQSTIPTNQQQMIQQLSKENLDLKKKLAEKDLELQKLKVKEEALEQKFKELQDQQRS
ncbi:unnamed protein product (macronuclear) [Paramecium tetraurelia]|uniref:Uncharacterized protein n=1 Tax=Paramecium tetraurelia TaxID=5888 RepID=A0BPM4_PARTE|nr:uncharacterized protein GSPATT00005240001 [Paramecium tetraurelia]CAK60491.1 unnamed protein product [Paramecium tetraurelia]|eukprot:XP_001427889.1 hypothetical protein (macronuclear) [Paramecium tetraurelia strain d4-2]